MKVIEAKEGSSKEFKQPTKRIEAKDSFAVEFKQPVKMIEAKQDLPLFDKEQALASVKKSGVFGDSTSSWLPAIQCWPTVEELRAKSEETLKQLRIKKVEWFAYVGGAIVSIRFTLSDNTVSEQIGTDKDLTNSFEFPEDRPIRKIKVRADYNSVY